MLWRDDDVSKYTDLTTLFKIQELFDKYNRIHTVTLIMDELWESRGVWEWLMTTQNIDIALHGFMHCDYSTMSYVWVESHIQGSLEYWEENSKRGGYKFRPLKVFYPPWNKVSDDVYKICSKYGLEVNTCVDESKVYNFHWWECVKKQGLDKLENRLKNDKDGSGVAEK